VPHINPALAPALCTWYRQVYTCCFLLTRHEGSAKQTAMQTFLHLGAEKECFPSLRKAELALFGWLLHNCEDFYYRKLRRIPRQQTLASQLTFPLHADLYALLRQSLPQRIAFALHHVLGCTTEEAAMLMKKPLAVVNALLAGQESSAASMLTALNQLPLTIEDREQMHDDLHLRFTERSVGVENKLRDIRSRFQRFVVILAVAVLILFAFSIYYATKHANGS